MLKPRKIILIALLVLTLGIAWKYYKKYRDSDKLVLGETSLIPERPIKTFKDLVSIFQNGLKLNGYIAIRNFSSTSYTLSELKVDCYTPTTNRLLAEQTNILQEKIIFKAQQVTNIPLSYTVSIVKALSLFKESGVIPADYTIWQIITKPVEAFGIIKMENLKMKLNGFVKAEGMTITINEDYKFYE